MKIWFQIINDFSHDMFTGLWFGSFFLLSFLRNRLTGVAGDELRYEMIHELMLQLFWLTACALGLVILTGLLRLVYSRDGQTNIKIKQSILIGKHVVLGSGFLVGTLLSYVWVY